MKQSKFFIEGMGYDQSGEVLVLKGYTKGSTWNGWAMPLFPKEEADKLIAQLVLQGETVARYDEEKDEYQIQLDDSDYLETYPAVEVDGMKLYDIGAGSWVWEEEYTKAEELRAFRKHIYNSSEELQDELADCKDYDNRFDLTMGMNGKQVSIPLNADLYYRLTKFIDETIEEEEA